MWDLEVQGAVSELSRRTRLEFPHIDQARSRTEQALTARRHLFADLPLPEGSTLCMMGSWGRRELVTTSDDDWLLLVDEGDPPAAAVAEIKLRLHTEAKPRPKPGSQDIFGIYAYKSDLRDKIGLDPDDNTNMTRRVLCLLESVPVTGEEAHRRFLDELLKVYIPGHVTFPRFLLNDVVRYWRTVCVDFAGKEREGSGPGWGLRNAKLRNSRKLLFASGLLPILLCGTGSLDLDLDIRSFLAEQLAAPATDRIAYAYLAADAADAGGRALGAYDQFLALLDDNEQRKRLTQLGRDGANGSPEFQHARSLGQQLQTALLGLLFETELFKRAARDYAIF